MSLERTAKQGLGSCERYSLGDVGGGGGGDDAAVTGYKRASAREKEMPRELQPARRLRKWLKNKIRVRTSG